MQIDKEVLTILNNSMQNEDMQISEANSDFKVGDQIYLRGSYGIGNDKYEIVKLTDSHDEEIKNCAYGDYLFKPEQDVINVAIIKNLENDELEAKKIESDGYYDYRFIAAADVEAIDLTTLDLTKLANDLSIKLSDLGIKADLTFNLKDPDKGMQYGKLELTSNNIVDQAGVCKLMLKELTVDSWGYANIWPQESKMGITLNFSYKHVGGGSNGHNFGRAIYDFTTGDWTLELDQDRY